MAAAAGPEQRESTETVATNNSDDSDFGFVAPSDLSFDFSNPRFPDEGFKTEEQVLEYLVGAVDVDELLQSIRSAGYVNFEPMIVERANRIVLEGNRRLAALRLLSNDALRNRLKVQLPDVPNPKPLPGRIRVKWVDNRTEARAFIGFKHINGPFKWDALAKAKFAAKWFEDGGDVVTISRTLGDNHNTVRRLVNGWYALKQAQDDGFDRDDRSKARFAFSHLYTALTRPSVREFLGLTPEDLSAPPKPDPVPAENSNNLRKLMSWLYGQESRGEPTIIQSQNPNLNQLCEVLGHPEAQQMLLARRDLRVAHERVEPPSSRFADALMKAARQSEEAMAASGSYDGDPTLLRVATNLKETTHGLVVVMQEKSRKKDE